MRTITLQQPFEFVRGDTERPAGAGPGEALVRVRRVGICGTDLHGFRGKQPFFSYPRVLGHELGVEVLAVGEGVTGVSVGDHCSVEPYLNCGVCIACRNGKPNCCTSLKVLGVHTDGGMRDEIVVPAHKLHVANDLTLDQLALVETLCIGAHAVSRAQLRPDEWALVIGAGPIGLSVIEFARQATRNVIVLDINEQRLAFCERHYGARTVLGDKEPLKQVEALTNGDLPTVVFDATGSPASMMKAFEYVAAGGKLVYVGLVQADITFHDPFLHRREITLFASRNATPADFDTVISGVRTGRVDTAPWITHRATFDDMVERFPSWLLPDTGVIKAVVDWA